MVDFGKLTANKKQIQQIISNQQINESSALPKIDYSNVNSIFNSNKTDGTTNSTANIAMIMAGGEDALKAMSEDQIKQYATTAALMDQDGDGVISEEEFEALDGKSGVANTAQIDSTDIQALYDEMNIANDKSMEDLLNEVNAILDGINIEEEAAAVEKGAPSIEKTGISYDEETGEYSVTVEKYQSGKAINDDGNQRYPNGSFWGIVTNAYPDATEAEKRQIYDMIGEMNGFDCDTHVLHTGDNVKLPILTRDENGKITGYEKAIDTNKNEEDNGILDKAVTDDSFKATGNGYTANVHGVSIEKFQGKDYINGQAVVSNEDGIIKTSDGSRYDAQTGRELPHFSAYTGNGERSAETTSGTLACRYGSQYSLNGKSCTYDDKTGSVSFNANGKSVGTYGISYTLSNGSTLTADKGKYYLDGKFVCNQGDLKYDAETGKVSFNLTAAPETTTTAPETIATNITRDDLLSLNQGEGNNDSFANYAKVIGLNVETASINELQTAVNDYQNLITQKDEFNEMYDFIQSNPVLASYLNENLQLTDSDMSSGTANMTLSSLNSWVDRVGAFKTSGEDGSDAYDKDFEERVPSAISQMKELVNNSGLSDEIVNEFNEIVNKYENSSDSVVVNENAQAILAQKYIDATNGATNGDTFEAYLSQNKIDIQNSTEAQIQHQYDEYSQIMEQKTAFNELYEYFESNPVLASYLNENLQLTDSDMSSGTANMTLSSLNSWVDRVGAFKTSGEDGSDAYDKDFEERVPSAISQMVAYVENNKELFNDEVWNYVKQFKC